MTNPDYAIEFLNITTQATATLLGFTIISWIFWWENLGKNIKFEGESKITYHYFINGYRKIETTFLDYFLFGHIPFTNRIYGSLIRYIKFDFLYGLIKQKTQGITYKSEIKKVNYFKLFLLYFIFVLILIGVYYIGINATVLKATTEYSMEELTIDPTFQPLIDESLSVFHFFIGAFAVFIITILLHSFFYKKSKLRKGRYYFDYIH